MAMKLGTFKSLLQALKEISRTAPLIIKTAREVAVTIKDRKGRGPASKVEAEAELAHPKEHAEQFQECVKALKQHAAAINKHSKTLGEQGQSMEELAAQGEELATLLNATSRWVKILVWLVPAAILLSIVAIVIAIIK
jgi:hypothetical protein